MVGFAIIAAYCAQTPGPDPISKYRIATIAVELREMSSNSGLALDMAAQQDSNAGLLDSALSGQVSGMPDLGQQSTQGPMNGLAFDTIGGDKVAKEAENGADLPPAELEIPGVVNLDDTIHRKLATRSLFQRMYEITLEYVPLGYITFGGPAAHVALMHTLFVEKKRWIGAKQYAELFGIAQALPGPASTQLAFALALIRDGVLPSLWAWVLWTVPGYIVMTVLAWAIARVTETPKWLIYLENGLVSSAVGLVALAAFKLGQGICKNDINKIIALVSAALTIVWGRDHVWLTPVLIVAGGIFHWLWAVLIVPFGHSTFLPAYRSFKKALLSPFQRKEEEQDASVPLQSVATKAPAPAAAASEKETPLSSNYIHASYGIRWGFVLLALWVILLVVFIVVKGIPGTDRAAQVLSTFWVIGSVIFGGGPVVIPLLESFVVGPGWATPTEFLVGLAVQNALPGPNFNFGAFCGALAMRYSNGALVAGSILGNIGMFWPGLLLMASIIPMWKSFRENSHIKIVLEGLNAAAVGLVFAATYSLLSAAITPVNGNGSSRTESILMYPGYTILTAATFVSQVLGKWNLPAPLMVGVGGFCGVMAWLAAGRP